MSYRPSFSSYVNKDKEGRDYYYLRLDDFSFGQNITNLLNNIRDEVAKTEYFVLDLRYNSGGLETKADTLLMAFLETDTLMTYPSVTRKNHAYYNAMGYGYPEYKDYYNDMAMDTLPANVFVKKDLPLFRQPLFILTSKHTYSVAEDFIFPLRLHNPGRAVLVGTPTGGSTGAPLVRRLPHHHSVYRICTRKALLPEGMIDNGIEPDYYYEMNIQDHLEGNDRIFDIVGEIYNEIYR